MKAEHKTRLLNDLQTAIEIELSTIPIYLYTYYSINRQPDVSKIKNAKTAETLKYYANKAGGLIMSVAVEEMLHMSLSSNVKRSLGGMPQTAGKSPAKYPTNLPGHKKGFEANLAPLSLKQLDTFLAIEKPDYNEKPTDKNWDTIGQFYSEIRQLIQKETKPEDFNFVEFQLGPGKGYYAPNNIDTVYPGKDGKPEYPNSHDSGDLINVDGKEKALQAIAIVCDQGEGFGTPATTKYDDKQKNEETHYYKYQLLHKELKAILASDKTALNVLTYPFPTNPTTASYPATLQPLSNLVNAVYTYLFMMTDACYRYTDPVQSEIFNAGMHKAMIFILDKLCGFVREIELGNGQVMAPTFENYAFNNSLSAKQQIIDLWETIPPKYQPGLQILERIQMLPDVDVAPGEHIRI